MEIVSTIEQVRERVAAAREKGSKIGFVPTMGAIHAGHLSLMDCAKNECDYVVVSIFVNPTQFGPAEDFEAYPRDIQSDAAKCRQTGVDLIFAPSVDEMYPVKNRCWVAVEGRLVESLCGAVRPGHFRGVTTVCMKLFNIVLPDTAYFGQKDAQQVAVLKAMVQDTNHPVSLRVCPIVREKNGLAMSSRNEYLTPHQREQAAILYESLSLCQRMYEEGCRDAEKLKQSIKNKIETCPLANIEYIEIVDFETFEPLKQINQTALIAVAVKIGKARLIDNILLTQKI
jgi:pantoate--beta-alanine ligase